MRDDALMADANLAEIARLTTQVQNLYDVIKEMRAEIDAERRARELAEADTAAYRRIIDALSRAGDLVSVRGVAGAALTTLRPGAQLLAELDAARAFIRAIRGAMLIGGWTDKQSALLAAYDAAVKASSE